MNQAPPLPPKLPSNWGLIYAAYVCCALAIIPFLGFVFGLAAGVLGARLCLKGVNTHGPAIVVLSPFLLFAGIPIAIFTLLTLKLFVNPLQDIFNQVAQDFATQPSP